MEWIRAHGASHRSFLLEVSYRSQGTVTVCREETVNYLTGECFGLIF